MCGICPEDKPYKPVGTTYAAEIEDIQQLYQTAADEDTSIANYNQISEPILVEVNGMKRIKVYHDGSCQLPRHPTLAHAGWGVAFL